MHRQDRRGDDAGNFGGQARQGDRPRTADQLDLHDGGLRCPRLGGADEATRRHARPDGQAIRRDHRDPDHFQLQGRALGSRILQLDPWRPQGTGRYGAEDRQFRLPDAPPGRCRARFHHHVVRLRDDVGDQGAGDHRRRAGGGFARDPHPRPHDRRGFARSGRHHRHRAARHAAGRARGGEDRPGRHPGGPHPLGSHLRGAERCLCGVLWARSRARHAGQYGRGGRGDCGAIDRRAGYAADHAHLPYRRCGPDLGTVVHRVRISRAQFGSRTATSCAIPMANSSA